MWVVISGTVRDHKSELSQKKVTHRLSAVNQPRLLAHIKFDFSLFLSDRSAMFCDDENGSLQPCLHSKLDVLPRQEDWHNLFMTSSSKSHTAGPQSRKGAKASI